MSRLRTVYGPRGEPIEEWRDDVLVWAKEPPKESVALQIVPDIAPYRSMVTGEMIESRSRHREHLREHRMIEIGNEVHHMRPFGKPPIVPGLKEMIARQVYAKLRY
jgi:hypothetical protein